MKKIFLRKIKKLLQAQKIELLQQSDQDLEIDHQGDETDAIQANILLGIAKQINLRNVAKLKQIEESLKCIEDQTYGICHDCNEPIPEKRLLINPYFQTCVDCAEDRELEQKQRVKL